MKQRSNASRNLSLVIWRGQQLDMFRYAAAMDHRGRREPLMNASEIDYDRMADEMDQDLVKPSWKMLLDWLRPLHGEEENEWANRISKSQHYDTVLHHRAGAQGNKPKLRAGQLQALRYHLFWIDSADLRESDLPSLTGGYIGEMWKKCMLHKKNTESAHVRAYIRCKKYEDVAARDSTYVRYIHTRKGGNSSTKFGQVEFFWNYQVPTGEREVCHMAYITEIPTITYYCNINNKSLSVRKIAKGATLGGGKSYFISASSIEALQAIVHHASDSYLAEKNSCFI